MSPTLAGLAAHRIVDPVLAVVFPSRCPACHSDLDHPLSGPLCRSCWAALPRHLGPRCRCGLPLAREGECPRCRRGLTPYSAGASVGPYEGTLRTLVHELKYRGRRRVADRLAEALLADAQAARLLTPEVVLAPVPLHPRRRRERGFNQSDLLARALARRARVAVVSRALARVRDTPAQTGLRAAERRRNVAGAFVLGRKRQLSGRVVVLVDDVLTTGATLAACARVLAAGGAREVRVLTVARVA